MNLANVSLAVSKALGKSGLVLKSASPEILIFSGITGLVGAGILACTATLKCDEVLAEHEDKLERIRDAKEKFDEHPEDFETQYTDKEYKKELTVAYVQTVVSFAKLYWRPLTLGAASIVCIIGGHGILRRRNAALAVAYAALDEGFKAYRKRVVEDHGEETDYMYKHGMRQEEYTDMEIDEETGKSKKVKKTKMTMDDPNSYSPYAMFFDESNDNWSSDHLQNRFFLQCTQKKWNAMLQSRGYVFLHEVYKDLGIEYTEAALVVGWVLGAKDSDNFIDFGIFDDDHERARAFINGHENAILLDFNVDGPIQGIFRSYSRT